MEVGTVVFSGDNITYTIKVASPHLESVWERGLLAAHASALVCGEVLGVLDAVPAGGAVVRVLVQVLRADVQQHGVRRLEPLLAQHARVRTRL
jgi:hypothetical protein